MGFRYPNVSYPPVPYSPNGDGSDCRLRSNETWEARLSASYHLSVAKSSRQKYPSSLTAHHTDDISSLTRRKIVNTPFTCGNNRRPASATVGPKVTTASSSASGGSRSGFATRTTRNGGYGAPAPAHRAGRQRRALASMKTRFNHRTQGRSVDPSIRPRPQRGML